MHHDREVQVFQEEGYLQLKKLIIADWLSAAERIGMEDSKENVREIGLSPIFSKIRIYASERPDTQYFYKGDSINFRSKGISIFPERKEHIRDYLADSFLANWTSFTDEFQKIREFEEDFDGFFTYLYSLIKQHFKFVPSAAYKVDPDISLFDHSKMVYSGFNLVKIPKDVERLAHFMQNINENLILFIHSTPKVLYFKGISSRDIAKI